jgi:flavin reductase (DIM6/NTAB) family NADH-FMN oxidoreductase RutF
MFYQLGYPKMIVLVTCKNGDKDNIVTLAWHSPLSHKPPLYGISVSSNRFSHKMISDSKEFGINFIDNNLRGEALYCGTHTGKIVDKFKETGLNRKRAKSIKAPLIREAVAWIECKVVNQIKTGDHTLFVGKVVSTSDTRKKSRIYDKGGKVFIQV